jgi:hypothetical protein
METKYLKFIHLNLLGRETQLWQVCSKSNNALLGEIKWYSAWRQYCFFPINALFNSTCLDDIKKFIDNLNLEHKRRLNEKKDTGMGN